MRSIGGDFKSPRWQLRDGRGGTAEPELGHPRGESEPVCICSSKTRHSLRPAAVYSAPQYSNQQSRMGVTLNGSHFWDPNLWTSITAWVTKLRNDFFFFSPSFWWGSAHHKVLHRSGEWRSSDLTIVDENEFTSRLDETNATWNVKQSK